MPNDSGAAEDLAYKQGALAFIYGVSRANNPFPKLTAQPGARGRYQQWLRGWDAEREAQEHAEVPHTHSVAETTSSHSVQDVPYPHSSDMPGDHTLGSCAPFGHMLEHDLGPPRAVHSVNGAFPLVQRDEQRARNLFQMDTKMPNPAAPSNFHQHPRNVTRQEAEDAVRTLIEWAGDDILREGLIDTPARVVRAYQEFFAGYDQDPVALLRRSFEETDGYDEIVLLRDIRLETHCEHHMVPIIGKVHIAYIPGASGRVVGISKLARIVDIFAKRLQIQEKLTAQIANLLMEEMAPLAVGVVIEAAHQCMTTRGVHKPGVTMVTSRMLGAFRNDADARRELLSLMNAPRLGGGAA